MSVNKKAALILCFLIGICLTATYIYYIHNQSNIIPRGIYIGQLDVGGLTMDEAKNKLKQWAMDKNKSDIVCKYEDSQWSISPTEIVDIDIDKTINNIFSFLDKGNFIQKYLQSKSVKNPPVHIDIVVKYNEAILSKEFYEINEKIKIEPTDAFFEVIDNTVTIVEEQNGILLDEEKLKDNIRKAMENGEYRIYIPTKIWRAERSTDDLEALEIKVKAAEFSTTFNSSQKERTENIKLSSNMLRGHIIAPGEVFSFNDVVGERTGEKGYREAPIFVKNDVVPGIGGGICQVSSTLYNLALLTEVEIVERLNHSLPVSYVPLGRDATVDYDFIDFKFKNTTGSYLLLDSYVKDNTLTISFFSSEILTKDAKFHSETIKTIPPTVTIKKDYNLNKGDVRIKQGNPGYQVRLWKT